MREMVVHRFQMLLPHLVATALLILLPTTPSRADIAPESGLLVHVQPVSGSCESPITDCYQITRSTSQDGPVEFVIFFMRGINSWPNEAVRVESVHDELSWPDAWQLLEFEQCGSAYGYADSKRATHALNLSWGPGSCRISDAPGGVIPVARLVMNVVGPGRLDLVAHYPQYGVTLRHGCWGSTFVTYPVRVFAEAGMQCGHISAHCGYHEGTCAAYFRIEELRLSAPAGSAADSTVWYWAGVHPGAPCQVTVDTHAPWCTAWTEFVNHDTESYLHVTADAAALTPGTYETAIELSAGSVSRCLPVVFTVEGTTATSTASWGRVKALYR